MALLPPAPALRLAAALLIAAGMAGCAGEDRLATGTPQHRIRSPADQPDEGTTQRRRIRDEGGPVAATPPRAAGTVTVTARPRIRHAPRPAGQGH